MSRRRHIRETVVQFLYAADPTEPLPSSFADSPALDLLLEPLRDRLTTARARAVVHLQQGRHGLLDGLVPLVQRLAKLDLSGADARILAPLRDLFESETEVRDALDILQRELKGNKDPGRLDELLQRIRLGNQQSRSAAARLRDTPPEFPALEAIKTDALAIVGDLPRHAERLEQALAPQPSDHPEFKAVRKAAQSIEDLRRETATYLEGIGRELPTLDAAIQASVENYRPERLDRVDRAILRLATYELLHCPDLSPAVAIDEAIELARTFGSTDSPRFANGVLDRIRKRASQSSDSL